LTLSLRTASPPADASVVPLLDACFQRAARESRLVQVLAADCPSYDPGMALLAENDSGPLGWALFLPREMSLRGSWVPCAVSAPFGVLPAERRRGVGRFLCEAGAQALHDRGIRAVAVLGSPSFFASQGYAPAFDLYTVIARGEDLPPAGDTSAWRGLRAEDIPHLRAMHFSNYAGVDGTEHRTEAPMDWESSIPSAFTLVLPGEGGPEAYLRFRIGRALEIRECAARSDAGIDGVLRFLHRILEEHQSPVAEVHVPPPHPIARELYHRGNTVRRSNFRGSAMLRVLDWRGLLEDTSESWADALRGTGQEELSLELDGSPLRLSLEGGALAVSEERSRSCHVFIPPCWGPPLLTGMRTHRDLLESAEVQARSRLGPDGSALLRRLFPGGSPMWTYSPVFEIADD
jgi:predicted N-acetyltransferase YhbS